MSIRNNKKEFDVALERAHKKYPPFTKLQYSPDNCPCHNFSFVIYCDSSEWDIVRCTKCGKEIVARCSFDDDYD